MITFSILILFPFAVMFEGWAILCLWKWFVVPMFNLPILTLPDAIGISFLAGLLTTTAHRPEDDYKPVNNLLQLLRSGFLRPAMYLALGWIVKGFV